MFYKIFWDGGFFRDGRKQETKVFFGLNGRHTAKKQALTDMMAIVICEGPKFQWEESVETCANWHTTNYPQLQQSNSVNS
jgi:hypothetical protein